MRQSLNLLLLLLFVTFTATGGNTSFQQTPKSVQGLVLDENNEPLIGASVTVPGTSIGTATDL
ncbi:MAG: carboxypeptidase-like regulatory domain-containing protein, partial [Dysgonamonadaceae bacterium]|nr:carboxypeptidase-like regulatory domain-containing protein [Dysgonamonadaceae bacterium]